MVWKKFFQAAKFFPVSPRHGHRIPVETLTWGVWGEWIAKGGCGKCGDWVRLIGFSDRFHFSKKGCVGLRSKHICFWHSAFFFSESCDVEVTIPYAKIDPLRSVV